MVSNLGTFSSSISQSTNFLATIHAAWWHSTCSSEGLFVLLSKTMKLKFEGTQIAAKVESKVLNQVMFGRETTVPMGPLP